MADPDPTIMKQLLADLRGFDKAKRRTAVMKLGMVGGDQAVRALIMTVRNEHEDLIARGRAAFMLGQLKDQRAVEPLIQALTAPGHQTPVFAAEALGKIGDRRAIMPLLTLLDSDNNAFREAALEALKRLGHNLRQEDF
ncbi:MAG: HEAT repeat domain-containing protein [Chloroflexi bacterium]|nr:HEAT repeat domain-containing protein [Chloroflexota bacterium]